MPKALKKITLFARKDDIDTIDTLNSVANLLRDYVLVWEAETATLANVTDVKTVNYEQMGKGSDLIIVVGGDGSILRSASAAMLHQTPVIGINKGRLGFLADVRPNELASRLLAVINGEYWTAERFLLHSSLKQANGSERDCGVALNDIVLYSSDAPRMLDFEIYVDEQFLCSHHADGLILATPTGSTAYSLSAGGPIIQPNVDAIVMLPMFSHSLTARPIIIPSSSRVRIEFSAHNETNAKLNCNANEIIDVPVGSIITVEQAAKKIKLLHPLDYDYYESLRSKLHWGHRLTN